MSQTLLTKEQIEENIRNNQALIEQATKAVAEARAKAKEVSGLSPEEAHRKLNTAMDNGLLPDDVTAAVREHKEQAARAHEEARQAAHAEARARHGHGGMHHRTV